MDLIKPAPLKRGDTVAVIAPSSPVKGNVEETLGEAERKIRAWGLEPVFLESCRSRHGFLAGDDRLRASDIHRAFSDRAYAGIVCLRGGYGTPRLLDRLDYDLIRKNAKTFLGYSDITALHIALYRKSRIVTLHGPMGISPENDYVRAQAGEVLFGSGPLGLRRDPPGHGREILVPGRAEGPLTGGNLSLLAATLGSPYEVDTRGHILFIEDVGEEPYRVDRMLTALRLAGKFRDCEGIILGTWTGCTASRPDYALSLGELFREILLPEGKPTVANVQFGHVDGQMILPYGVRAVLDGEVLSLIETHAEG